MARSTVLLYSASKLWDIGDRVDFEVTGELTHVLTSNPLRYRNLTKRDPPHMFARYDQK